MATKRSSTDPIEAAILRNFRSRSFGWERGSDALWVAEEIARGIQALIERDPARAARLYGVLIGECMELIEDLDEDGEFTAFIESLYPSWIRARRLASRPAAETAAQFFKLRSVFFFDIAEVDAAAVAAACDEEHLEALAKAGAELLPGSVGLIRAVLRALNAPARYIAFVRSTGLKDSDYGVIAELLEAAGEPAEALKWTTEGMDSEGMDFSPAGLDAIHRRLLKTLGRGEEALASAWVRVRSCMTVDGWRELMDYAPAEDRADWHERAMDAAGMADLDEALEIWMAGGEQSRIIGRIAESSDGDLEAQSHYVTEPVAKALEEDHPALAARVYRALGVRILKSGKSQYYREALHHLDSCRTCYLRAAMAREWEALAREIQRAHSRKHSFMPAFETVVKGRWIRI